MTDEKSTPASANKPTNAKPDADANADKKDPKLSEPPTIVNAERPHPKSINRVINAIKHSAIVDSSLTVAELSKVRSNNTPWALEQFFSGDIDLDNELSQRFPNMPLMSVFATRDLDVKQRRGVVTISAQDGAAQMIADVDSNSKVMIISFIYGSMLNLRFRLDDLSDKDRNRWMELMRREEGGLAFLWSESRWEKDYVICSVRRYYTNFYAFSAKGFEAAIRLTPDMTKQFLDWLVVYWGKPTPPPAPTPTPPIPPESETDTPSDLLTW